MRDANGFAYAFAGDTPRDSAIGILLFLLIALGAAIAWHGIVVLAHAHSAAAFLAALLAILTGAGMVRVGAFTGY